MGFQLHPLEPLPSSLSSSFIGLATLLTRLHWNFLTLSPVFPWSHPLLL